MHKETTVNSNGKSTFFQYIDTIFVLLLGFGILFSIPHLINFSSESSSQFESPTLFPKILAYLLIVLGAVQLFFKLKGHFSSKERKIEKTEIDEGEIKPFLFGVITLIIYIFLIPIFGFYFATLLSFFCFIYYFGKPKWYYALLFSIVSTSLIYYVFGTTFNVPLPTSILL